MVRGLDEGLLDDLWNFPSAFGRTRVEALASLRNKLAGFDIASFTLGDSIAELRHGITYRTIYVHAYPGEVSHPRRIAGLRWFPVSSLGQAAISQLARKIAQQVL